VHFTSHYLLLSEVGNNLSELAESFPPTVPEVMTRKMSGFLSRPRQLKQKSQNN